MGKLRVNLYLSKNVKDELLKQSRMLGMDMGSYFAYLIMKEKERLEKESQVKDWIDAVMELIKDD